MRKRTLEASFAKDRNDVFLKGSDHFVAFD